MMIGERLMPFITLMHRYSDCTRETAKASLHVLCGEAL